jgi:hypothetical protein
LIGDSSELSEIKASYEDETARIFFKNAGGTGSSLHLARKL